MAHRNRWFTWVYLLIAWWFSMAMLVITRWYIYIYNYMVIINKLQNGWDVGPLQLWLSHFLVELQPQHGFFVGRRWENPHFSMCKIASIRNLSTEIHIFIGGGSPLVLGVPPWLSLRFPCFAGWPISALATWAGRHVMHNVLRSLAEKYWNWETTRKMKKVHRTNYQHLSTIIWYLWNGMKIHRAWVETCGKSRCMNLSLVIQPSETSDQTQIISDPSPVALQQSVRSMDPWPAGTTSRTCAEESWPRRPHGDK